MATDQRKTKSELIAELAPGSPTGGPGEKLKQHLKYLRAEFGALEARCDEQTQALRQECSLRDQTEEALRLAEIIISRSPVVLFRAWPAKNPLWSMSPATSINSAIPPMISSEGRSGSRRSCTPRTGTGW